MRYRIIVAGKPALEFTKGAIVEYLKRLSRFGSYEFVIVKAGDSEQVSKRLLDQSEGCYRVALDERGKAISTRNLVEKIERWEMAGEIKEVAFLIGAADGHTAELKSKSDLVLSLSTMTMQHELALVVLLEQLYRIGTIKKGTPYHRD